MAADRVCECLALAAFKNSHVGGRAKARETRETGEQKRRVGSRAAPPAGAEQAWPGLALRGHAPPRLNPKCPEPQLPNPQGHEQLPLGRPPGARLPGAVGDANWPLSPGLPVAIP